MLHEDTEQIPEPIPTTPQESHSAMQEPVHPETIHYPSYTDRNHSAAVINHTYPHNNDFRLLIGVMSPFTSVARRYMIRGAYNQFPELPVDVVFVQANVPTPNHLNAQRILAGQRNITSWENSTSGDIVHLDCEYNKKDGISYEFFRKVGLEFGNKYTHVMKTTRSTFINIPGTTPCSYGGS